MFRNYILTKEQIKELEKKREREKAEKNGHYYYICQECKNEFSIYMIPHKNNNGERLDSVKEVLCFTCSTEINLKKIKQIGLQDK